MSNVDLSESLGLVAYYQSKDFNDLSIQDLTKYRKNLLSDFKKSVKSSDIKYLLYIMLDYPKDLAKKILSSDQNQNNINKTSDLKALKNTNNKLIKKYIKSKMYKSDFEAEDLDTESDSDEIIKFLINFDQEYERQILESLNK